MHSPSPGRLLLIVAMCLGTMLSMFNSTMVNVMVPAIGAEFRVPAVGLEWVSAAYTLTFGAFLLLGGALGASLGRRPMFLLGVWIFLAATAVCALAPGLLTLLIGRGIQGVGIAIVAPQTLAILSTEFTDPKRRAQMVGLWAGLASLGLSAGPVIGGVIVSLSSWRLGFAFSAALAVITVVFCQRGVSPIRHGAPSETDHRIDWVGAILGSLGLAGLTEALMQFPDSGFSPLVVGSTIVAVVLLPGFVWWQIRQGRLDRPALMPMSVWRSRDLVASNIAGVAYFFMFFGILYFYSVEFQDGRGLSAMATGFMFLPMMLFTALFGPIAGRLAGRFGVPPVLIAGLLLGGLGSGLLAVADPAATIWDVEWRLAVVGIASGLMSSSMSNLAVSGVPGRLSSTAAAIHNTFRQVGSTLGVAIIGAIIAAYTAIMTAEADPGSTSGAGSFVSAGTIPGLSESMIVTAVLMIVSAAACWILTHRRR